MKGSYVKGLVMSQQFQQQTMGIVKAITPLYQALKVINKKRYPQKGFLYHIMIIAKAWTKQANSKQNQAYIDIIKQRWIIKQVGNCILTDNFHSYICLMLYNNIQVQSFVHRLNQLQNILAAYYLNPKFQYCIPGIDLDNELLTAFHNVINKVGPYATIGAQCLKELLT